MLKRLIFAAMILGIFLAFSSAALADDGPPAPEKKARVFPGAEVPNPDKVQYIFPDVSAPDGFQRLDAPTPMGWDNAGPMAASPEYGCEFQDFCNYTGAYYGYELYGEDNACWANQYLVPEHHSAEVYGLGMRIYGLGVDNGGCDIVATVWEDDGGVPGAVIYTETFAAGTFGTGSPEFVFSTPVVVHASSYMMGFTAVGHADDYIYFGMYKEDPEEDHERSFYDGGCDGTWISMSAAFGEIMNLRGYSDVCYTFSLCYDVGYRASAYQLPLPDPDWGTGETTMGFSQRFVSTGPDTVKIAKIQHLDQAAYGTPLGYYDATSTNYYIVSIMGDDAGVADPTNIFASIDVGPGLDALFPASGNVGAGPTSWWDTLFADFTGMDVVMLGPWHLVVEPSSDDPAEGQLFFGINADETLDGLGINFEPPENNWTYWASSPTWVANLPTAARSMKATVEVCQDEFYSCQNQVLYDSEPWGWSYSLTGDASVGNLAQFAQLVKSGGSDTRIEKIRFQIALGDGVPGIRVNIYDDGGTNANGTAGPGAVTHSYDIEYGDIVDQPGWNEVVIPDGGVIVVGDFYVGYELIPDDPMFDRLYALTEDATGIQINGGALLWHRAVPGWLDMSDQWGYTDNLMFEVEMCSIPFTVWECAPGDDWATINGDFARTGHSGDALEDAWCDLNLAGMYEHPTWGTIRCGPVIWEDYVIQCFSGGTSGGYFIFDLLNVGAGPLDEITTTTHSASIGGALRCTPTVADIGGTPTLFVAGGTQNSVAAYDMTTVGGPITEIWSANPFNGWLGHDINGTIRYGNFIVLDEVLYFGDDGGRIHAAEAATGLPFAGWGGHVQLIGNPLRSGATDGTNLYYSIFTAGIEGDVVALDPATGDEVWSLAGGDGLQAVNLFAEGSYNAGTETFSCGPAVDGGEVYISANATGDGVGEEAIFYRLNAANGAVLSFAQAQRVDPNGYTHPVIDATNVFMLTTYAWSPDGGQLGGSVVAYSRTTGEVAFAFSPPGTAESPWERWIRNEGVLSCEPIDIPDILMGFSGGRNLNVGYLSFFNANTGEEYFHRRIDHGPGGNVGGAGAMGSDSNGDVHVLFADAWGTLYDFTKGDDRSRLEVINWNPQVPVPFGSPADVLITFADVYVNSGCADLIVDLEATDTDNGVTPGGAPGISVIRDAFAANAAGLANSLAANSNKFPQMRADLDVSNEVEDLRANSTGRSLNRSAMAVPSYLIEQGTYPGDVFDPPGGGIVTAPGDTADIVVRVVGDIIARGPQSFFITFAAHNDPDYFLNDNSLLPQLTATLVGGCLQDTTLLVFGPGEANHQWVFNTLMEGDPDYPGGSDPDGNMAVNGFSNGNFAGFYCYGVSQFRMAMHAENWRGQGDDAQWISIQADPNYCSDDCKPALTSGVSLGMASLDGVTYEPLTGNLICKSFIDSVQNFWDGASWDWNLYKAAPFDNDSTMGIAGNSRVFAVVDAPAGFELLNNLHVEIFDLWERNGNEVLNWKFGSVIDNDVVVDFGQGTYDTVIFDQSVSSGWATLGDDITGGQAGFVKLPFGGDYDPMVNAFPWERAQNILNDANGNNWDSLFYYLSIPPNTEGGNPQAEADDGDGCYSIVWHDFQPNEEFSFAVASYYFTENITNAYSSDEFVGPAANLVNKWVGFGRGDVDNDNAVTLGDVIYLAEHINSGGPGPIPFEHLGDVNNDSATDIGDVTYMVDYYFNYGPAPVGDWTL